MSEKDFWEGYVPEPVKPAQLPFGVGGGLVAIKTLLSRDPCVHANTAIQMIDAILAEQPAQQEPVAWMFQHGETGRTLCVDAQQVKWGFEERNPSYQKIAPLYTSPPAQRTWMGLTDEEAIQTWGGMIKYAPGDVRIKDFARAVEAKLKEKNT